MSKKTEKTLNEVKHKLRVIFLVTTIAVIFVVLFFTQKKSNEFCGTKEIDDHITAIKSNEDTETYKLGSELFTIPKNNTVSISNGIDFSVYQFIINEKDTFGLYSGWYPTFPSEINMLANKRKREQHGFAPDFPKERLQILNTALKEGVYIGKLKAEDFYDYELDLLIPPKFDSLSLTVFSDSMKTLWILEPPIKETGGIDIVIQLNEKDNHTFHLFNHNSNPQQRKVMIEVAKSIK